VAEHLVIASLFDVEYLTFQREDGLEFAVAALLGGSACALSLNEVELATVGLPLGAVGELAGKSAAVECAFAASEVAGLAGSFARTGCVDGFVDDLLGDGRVLLEECAETLVYEGLDGTGDVGVQFALGLAFELRLRELDAYDDYQTFADVVAFTSLKRPRDWPAALMVRVSAVLKPERWVPPSTVLMLLAKVKTVSE
jgi:hypothetical protein